MKKFILFAVLLASFPAHADDMSLVEKMVRDPNILVTVDAKTLADRVVVPESDIDTSFDRRRFLSDLFQRVAAGSTTSDRVEAWVHFLQDRIAHPLWPPMHTAVTMVMDPMWLLEHRIGQCGQTNRVLVDGLLAVGIQARLVQLSAHVAAEAFYDGQWHYLDADWLSLGQFIRKPDGTIPSTEEIYANTDLLKTVQANSEFDLYPISIIHPEHYEPYEKMFTRVKLGNYETPFYYVKTATPEQEHNALYGWNYYKTEQ